MRTVGQADRCTRSTVIINGRLAGETIQWVPIFALVVCAVGRVYDGVCTRFKSY